MSFSKWFMVSCGYRLLIAKAGLDSLIKRAKAWAKAALARHGKPTVRPKAGATPKQPIPSLAEFRKKAPPWRKSSAELLREIRDKCI
jgi:hypothetical protein